jgi:hypothetical protein
MALTSSGQIKISEINTEFGRTSTTANSSLEDLSDGTVATINTGNASANRPDTNAPHAMSEFYSYDHDLVTNATFGSWVGSFTSGDTVRLLGSVGGSDVISGAYQIGITGSSGALLCGRSDSSGDSLDATLKVALSTSGDPGTGGTSNSAGGFQTLFNTSSSFNDGISDLSGDVTMHVRWLLDPHPAKSDSSVVNFHMTNNGGHNSFVDIHCIVSSFGGLCLHESIPVNTPDGYKLFNELSVGDIVYSHNLKTNQIEETEIGTIESPVHDNLYKVNDLIITDDHPIFNDAGELLSIKPELSLKNYDIKTKELKIGAKLKTIDNGDYEVKNIERYEGEHLTYTILTKNSNFYAGGVLAHSEVKASMEINPK